MRHATAAVHGQLLQAVKFFSTKSDFAYQQGQKFFSQLKQQFRSIFSLHEVYL